MKATNENKTFVVYKHTAPNGKAYIGITSKKPEHRWNHGRAYYQNKYFSNAIQKYGWDNFNHEILEENLSREKACELEKYFIKKFRSNEADYGYNLSAGGENPADGVVKSEETREKIRNANTGKKFSEERKRRISESKTGRSNGLTGRKGKQCNKSGLVYQIEEGTNRVLAVFYGYCEAARITGYAMTPIKEAANGTRKRAYGYLWEYRKRGKEDVVI